MKDLNDIATKIEDLRLDIIFQCGELDELIKTLSPKAERYLLMSCESLSQAKNFIRLAELEEEDKKQ